MTPELEQIITLQRGVFRRSQAMANGYDDAAIRRLERRREWRRVRHGIWTTAARWAGSANDPRRRHLLYAAARQLAIGGDTVVSHQSAAVLHRLDLLDAWPGEPVLTRHRPTHAPRMTAHGLFVAPVPPAHRLNGVPVTSAARTVADCARTLPREAAFVTAESALRLGLSHLEVLDVLAACAGWPGAAEARDVIAMAGRWSESPLESLHRLWFMEQGLPQPEQQRLIVRPGGGAVARVDFVWPQHRTVCEADGRLKYDDSDALWQEKLREDVLRDLGLEVVRGYWRDRDDDGAALAERLRRAFRRGARATDEPAYRIISPPEPAYQPLSLAV